MVISFVAGTLLVIGWIVVAFVIAVTAGWVHLLLAAGTVMIARGIVLSPAAGKTDGQTDGQTDKGQSS